MLWSLTGNMVITDLWSKLLRATTINQRWLLNGIFEAPESQGFRIFSNNAVGNISFMRFLVSQIHIKPQKATSMHKFIT